MHAFYGCCALQGAAVVFKGHIYSPDLCPCVSTERFSSLAGFVRASWLHFCCVNA